MDDTQNPLLQSAAALEARLEAVGGFEEACRNPLRFGALLLGTDLTLSDVLVAAEHWALLWTRLGADDEPPEGVSDEAYMGIYATFLVGLFTALQHGNLLAARGPSVADAAPEMPLKVTAHVAARDAGALIAALDEMREHVAGDVPEPRVGFTGKRSGASYSYYFDECPESAAG